MYQVTFQFENGDKPVVFSASPNMTLLEAARSANVAIDAPCSGNGSCGKCRVKILSGEVESYPSSHISEEEYAAGWRLSCASKVIGDVTVEVPDIASAYQSRMKTADLSTGKEVEIFRKLQQDLKDAGINFHDQHFVQSWLELDEPTLDDTMPDTERLIRAVQAVEETEDVRLTYHVVRKLAKTLRDGDFKVMFAGVRKGDTVTVIDVTTKNDAPFYGCAIDIGTTTVTGVLVELTSGEIVAKASAGNGQIRYGADVINRIIEQGKPGGVKRLQDAILKETLRPMVGLMCKTAGITADRIFRVCIASNTTMNHLLLGVDADPVRMEEMVHRRVARNADDEPSPPRRGCRSRPHGAVYPDVLPVARAERQGPLVPGKSGRGGAHLPEHRLLRRRRHHRGRADESDLGQGRILAVHRPRHEWRAGLRQPRLHDVLRLLGRPGL